MRAHDAQKNEIKPWPRRQRVIPPRADADFVRAMEDALEVYARLHDPACPAVCPDEIGKRLVAETRIPIPAEPGRPEPVDYGHERRGTANLFLTGEPLAGQRHVTVTDRRTAMDFAEEIKDLLEVHHPGAAKAVLVLDSPNARKPAALY